MIILGKSTTRRNIKIYKKNERNIYINNMKVVKKMSQVQMDSGLCYRQPAMTSCNPSAFGISLVNPVVCIRLLRRLHRKRWRHASIPFYPVGKDNVGEYDTFAFSFLSTERLRLQAKKCSSSKRYTFRVTRTCFSVLLSGYFLPIYDSWPTCW